MYNKRLCVLCNRKADSKSLYCKYCKSTLYRAKNYKHKYNIELDDYNRMFKKQKGRCAICGIHQSKLKKRLSIDHNHKNGKVRGLLCDRCNFGIGIFHDRKTLLFSAIQYLIG